jgi:hypothetical protein
MPWSMWVVMPLLLGSLSPYGAFFVLLLCAPLLELFKHVQFWPAAPIAKAIGTQPIYIWPAIALLALGSSFLILAVRKPENTAYENAAILVLGFLLAATTSIYQLRGWAGV